MQQQQMPQPQQQQPPQYGLAPQLPQQQQQQAGPMGLQPGPNGPMMQPPMQYMPTPGGEARPQGKQRLHLGTPRPHHSNASPMHGARLSSS
jgi:hypothetical protein